MNTTTKEITKEEHMQLSIQIREFSDEIHKLNKQYCINNLLISQTKDLYTRFNSRANNFEEYNKNREYFVNEINKLNKLNENINNQIKIYQDKIDENRKILNLSLPKGAIGCLIMFCLFIPAIIGSLM